MACFLSLCPFTYSCFLLAIDFFLYKLGHFTAIFKAPVMNKNLIFPLIKTQELARLRAPPVHLRNNPGLLCFGWGPGAACSWQGVQRQQEGPSQFPGGGSWVRGPEDRRDLLSPDLGMPLSPLPSRTSSAAEEASGPSLALYLPPCGCNSEAPPTCL